MLRIAVQAKGRLYDETMSFLEEADIKLSATKRTLLVQSSNFPIEVLFLRDDDIPQTVATGVADIGIVGENEFVERAEDAEIVKRCEGRNSCDNRFGGSIAGYWFGRCHFRYCQFGVDAGQQPVEGSGSGNEVGSVAYRQ